MECFHLAIGTSAFTIKCSHMINVFTIAYYTLTGTRTYKKIGTIRRSSSDSAYFLLAFLVMITEGICFVIMHTKSS